jgi:hypothetical protein
MGVLPSLSSWGLCEQEGHLAAPSHSSATARCLSTFLSCAFREQEDDQATRSFLLRQVLKHISDTSTGASNKRRNVHVFADGEVVVR